MSGGFSHEPVLAEEVLGRLRPEGPGIWIDGTVGGGGHAERLLKADPELRLIGVDQDDEALEAATRRLAPYADRTRLNHGNFRDVAGLVASETETMPVRGVLLDLGVSSYQLDEHGRGFSFRRSTPLDMRMGGTAGGRSTAADVLNEASQDELGRIFREYGEERHWRALAREIVKRRATEPFATSDDFVAACTVVLGGGLSAATKARLFQALRIAVNDEMDALEQALPAFRDLLAPQGRFVVIAYHSLEDRLVKNAFREWSRECVCPPELPMCRCRGVALGRLLTKKPVRPSPAEVDRNPRSRSARLRAWERAA
ncbi:MAG: 16S rRNA (cytosine(1402)-N(4))-methyltransferase RsmH [Gemmatimonadota bacterium]